MGAAKSPLRVGIQGVRASFHEVAARKYFSEVEFTPVECASFSALSAVLNDGEADYCVMAIENSIAGSILTNYSLLETFGFKIVGEIYLRIEMSLLALPGQSIDELQLVRSHPMALLQCADFLASYPKLSVLEAADTAESAKIIAEQKLRGQAAIASALAADAYGLQVLREGIESNKQNYTRFLVICRHDHYKSPLGANKASIRFESGHAPGSLVRILSVFGRESVNMTKVQSVPILGRPYEYSFHVDLEWDDRSHYDRAMSEVADLANNLIHFGEYDRGDRPTL